MKKKDFRKRITAEQAKEALKRARMTRRFLNDIQMEELLEKEILKTFVNH